MQLIAKCEWKLYFLSFFFLLRFQIWIGHWISCFCLMGDQLVLGLNEQFTFTHYQENHRGLPAGREITDFYYGSLNSAAHQWGYISANVQLTQDRWSKFTSNQCWGRSDREGSPDSPMGPPRPHCHWRMVQFDMFHQVTPCKFIYFESEIHARE